MNKLKIMLVMVLNLICKFTPEDGSKNLVPWCNTKGIKFTA